MEENSDKLFNDLLKVYLAQMDSSIKISNVLYEHSGNEELTGDDIICGLVYRLMVPMTQDEINESMNKADELLADPSDSDDSDDDDDSIQETYAVLHPSVLRKIKSNNCNCEICSKVRVCLENYHKFDPLDQLAHRFKDSIQKTCEVHNIYI
jgi:hypothetical protein